MSLLFPYSEAKDDVWYLANGIPQGFPQGVQGAVAIRRVNGIMQIAVNSSEDDFWYCTMTYEDEKFTINSINEGGGSVVLDETAINDYMVSMNCQTHEFVIAEPVNVNYVIEV